MFWGTDRTKLASCHEAITLFTEELPWLTADDKAWVMGRGLCAWLRSDAPHEPARLV
jgi:hypothetical protein